MGRKHALQGLVTGQENRKGGGAQCPEHQQQNQIQTAKVIASHQRATPTWYAGDTPTSEEQEVKQFYEQSNIGQARYVVNFHDGVKVHDDGSPFFDLRIFTNKVARDAFIKLLCSEGYVQS